MHKRVVFVGGGSGGHFYPLMAVAGSLRQEDTNNDWSLYYMGSDPYEPETLASLNIKFVFCPAGKLRRYFSYRNVVDFVIMLSGIFVAFFKLLILYPDVIFSKGGYTSVPAVIAAKLLRIPLVIHESDAVPGRANTLAKRTARYIGIAYDDAAQFFPPEKTALVGIPTRKNFFVTATKDSPHTLNIDPNRPMIFVTGGSQGAERINNLILESLDELLPTYSVLHQTGTANYENITQTAHSLLSGTPYQEHYHPRDRLTATEFSLALELSAIVITRAGSTTLHEISLKGKPSIVIPIPEDVSHDQKKNAYAYARGGAATVIEEQNLSDGVLSAEITRILTNQELYQRMVKATEVFSIKGAAEQIAGILLKIGNEH